MKNSATSPLIRLYGLVSYDRSAKARWLLTEMGLTFENRWLDRETKEFESPEYLRINPMGRIPAVEIDDQTLFESGAICAYLADRFLDRGLAPALSAPERADYQKWMYFAASTVDTFATRMMIIEDMTPGETHSEKETALLTELRDGLGVLEQALSKSSYLVANRFSAADICVSYHLYWCTLWPEMNAIVQTFPRVLAFMENLKKMPSAVQAKVFSYEA